MITARTPWFWDTPEGGGWTLWLTDGESADRYTLERRIEREADAEQRAEYQRIENMRPRRDPTPGEKQAWRKIDPRVDGDPDAETDEL